MYVNKMDLRVMHSEQFSLMCSCGCAEYANCSVMTRQMCQHQVLKELPLRVSYGGRQQCKLSNSTLEPRNNTWITKLWLYLSNENDEERMLRHKGDLPTTQTDTNFIVCTWEKLTTQQACLPLDQGTGSEEGFVEQASGRELS